MRAGKIEAVQMNLTIDKDLRDWFYTYAKRNRLPATKLIMDYIIELRERESKRTNILGMTSIPSGLRED